jgi:hypothetical protein
MATMNSSTNLSKDPNGEELELFAALGDEVKILNKAEIKIDGNTQSWTWVKLIQANGQPDGWAPSDTVDEAGAPDPTIDRKAFAVIGSRQADSFGILAHYLLAIAELRSKITGGSDAAGIGPFRLNAGEWEKFRKDSEFNYNFDPENISEWSAQCAVFSLMIYRAQTALAAALGRDPNAVELCLAQMIGVKPATTAINTQVLKLFDGVDAGDLPPGGLSADDILNRYKKMLKDGANARTWQQAEPVVFQALKDALDKTADLVPKATSPTGTVVNPIKPGNSVPVEATEGPGGKVFGPFTKDLWQRYCDILGFRESGNNYTSLNQFNFAGRWQFGCGALIDTGHVQPGTKTARGGAPNSNWLTKNGVSSLATWRSTKSAQDAAMIDFTNRYYNFLTHNGLSPDAPVPHIAGLLAAAHLKGPGNALELLKGHVTQDANGTTTLSYYRLLNIGMGGSGKLP